MKRIALSSGLFFLTWLTGVDGQRDFGTRRLNTGPTDAPDTLLIRCYGRWGCLSIGGPFFAPNRPVSVFPLHPEVLHIKFLLWTRRNPDTFHLLKSRDNATFALSAFDAARPIKMILHDYHETGTTPWIQDMARELLTADNYNVISVDWQNGAVPPYSQAVANSRMVGAVVGDFIQFLQDRYRVSPNDIHLIGYGLGAHAAGYAGESSRGLARITGLNPSAPYFERTAPEVRLDPSDAQFVDVIHTDDSGIREPVGHLDFYPNGGRHQPGCGEGLIATQQPAQQHYLPAASQPYFQFDIFGRRRKRSFRQGSASEPVYFNCNQARAHQLFIESINSDCPFYAFQCDSFRNFTEGHCSEGCGNDRTQCAPIGLHADEWQANSATANGPVSMYAETDHVESYCRHHYQIRLLMQEGDEAAKHGNETGRILVRLTGSKGRTPLLEATAFGPALFVPGQHVDSMVSGDNLGRLLRLDVEWLAAARHPHHLDPNSYRFPELYVDQFIVTNLETGIKSTFCVEGDPMKPSEPRAVFVGGSCDNRENRF